MTTRAGGGPTLVGLDVPFETLRAQRRELPAGARAETLLVTCHATCEVALLDRLGPTLRLRTHGRDLEEPSLAHVPLRAVLELGVSRVLVFGTSGCPSVAAPLSPRQADPLARMREAAAQWHARRAATDARARSDHRAIRASLAAAGHVDVEVFCVTYAAETGLIQRLDETLDQLACAG